MIRMRLRTFTGTGDFMHLQQGAFPNAYIIFCVRCMGMHVWQSHCCQQFLYLPIYIYVSELMAQFQF